MQLTLKKGLVETQSIFSKLLAEENIDVLFSHAVKTASFDVKHRRLVLPAWVDVSKNVYDMLVVHEVGHALHTSDDFYSRLSEISCEIDTIKYTQIHQIIHSIFNVIEDVRCDNLQKKKYPGSKKTFSNGYNELFEKEFFGKTPINELNFIDRINVHFKVGIFANVKFAKNEESLVERIGKLSDIEDAYLITRQIYEMMKDDLEQKKESKESQKSNERSNDKTDNSQNDDIEDNVDDDNDIRPSGKSENLKAETQEAFKEALEHKIDNHHSFLTEGNDIFPEFNDSDIKKYVEDYKSVLSRWSKNYNKAKSEIDFLYSKVGEFIRKNKDVVSKMIGRFLQKKAADISVKKRINRTGILNTNKMFQYRFNDELFKRRMTVQKGKNHGFFMILDWSSSMKTNIRHTMEEIFRMTMFCRSLNIPFEVYLFSGYQLSDFRMSNILSSRMSLDDFNKACAYLWYITNTDTYLQQFTHTPLNEAIGMTDVLARKFKEANNVQILNLIFLTDGCSNVGFRSNEKASLITDKRTKKIYSKVIFPHHNTSSSIDTTHTYIKILKDRLQCNVIGFFLKDPSDFDYTFKDDTKKFKDYDIIYDCGYDILIIINQKKMNSQRKMMYTSSNLTSKQIENEYIENLKSSKIRSIVYETYVDYVTQQNHLD